MGALLACKFNCRFPPCMINFCPGPMLLIHAGACVSLTCEWVGHEIGEGENEVDERDVLDSNADILHMDSEVRDEGEGGTREEEYDQLQRQRSSIRLHPELR